LEELDDKITAAGGSATLVPLDIKDSDGIARLALALNERYGKLDVLVGNAGIFDFRRPLESYTPDTLGAAFDEIFAVNLKGYMLAAMAAREALAKSNGSMIFTASVASIYAGGGGILYSAVKHGVAGFIRELARELAPAVRVNGVGPGGTLTNLRGSEALGQQDRSLADAAAEVEARIAASVPLRFAQRPEDHTGLYVLLASRENSRAVTGEIYMSDGGLRVRPL
jgi:NAD(P)-dependent dehydrogenase (short-subunit alcohol dehydrogenase family)